MFYPKDFWAYAFVGLSWQLSAKFVGIGEIGINGAIGFIGQGQLGGERAF